MAFRLSVGQQLNIADVVYRVAEHPSAPGQPYGQEGRQAVVYQLLAEDGTKHALKVFKPRYRAPTLVTLAERLEPHAGLPGLQVCRRTVLTPHRHMALLQREPDLTYAVLMPWVEGATWMEILLGKRELTSTQCLRLARSLADVLATMEQHGLAHCDLSGPNVLVGRTSLSSLPRGVGEVALVDVEQMHAPDLRRPLLLPGGSPGYAHRTAPDGLWSPDADRFAGAVLLAEMLCWCDEAVRAEAWGESYFDPAEMQAGCRRYRVLCGVLKTAWGEAVLRLFERAWHSDTLSDCGTFGEWLVALPGGVPERITTTAAEAEATTSNAAQPQPADADLHAARALVALGQQLAREGQCQAAVSAYRQAQLLAVGTSLAGEVASLVAELEGAAAASTPPGSACDTEEMELARLFDEGAAACERGGWQRAAEPLAEVVRRMPGHVPGGNGRRSCWSGRGHRRNGRTKASRGCEARPGCWRSLGSVCSYWLCSQWRLWLVGSGCGWQPRRRQQPWP